MPETSPSKGLTLRAFLVGLALVLVWLLYDCTLAVDEGLGGIEMLYCIGFGALFTIFAVQALNNALQERWRLSRHELTIVYTMVSVAVPWGILIRAALEAPLKLIIVHRAVDDPTGDWLTAFWAPKSTDAIYMFGRGGYLPHQIPWGEWLLPILYWSAILLSFQLFAIFVVLFYRRIFIDEEKLPFPMASVGQSIVEYTPTRSDETSARRSRTAVRIAFLIGVFICLPGILSVAPGTYSPIPINSQYYGTSTGIIQGLWVTLSWDPFILCFLMFFPLEFLFTVGLVHVGLRIFVPTVFLWMGLPNPSNAIGSFMFYGFGFGGILGLVIWPMIFNRRLFADAIRRVFTGDRSPNVADPYSFRVVVVGLLLSFAAFAALVVVGMGDIGPRLGTHVLSLLLTLFVIVVFLLGRMRENAENGWRTHSPWGSVGGLIARSHFHWLPKPPIWNTQSSFLTISHTIHFGSYHNTFGPHLHVFDALRIASHTGTDTREIMKVVFLTLLIGLVIVVPGYLMLMHYYGFDRSGTTDEWLNFYNYEQPQHIIAYGRTTGEPFAWFSMCAGFAIFGIVMRMRRNLVVFPIMPVGILFCGMSGSWFPNWGAAQVWFPVILVFVIKRTIYRWFGVRFFRTHTIPIVIHVMMGLMTGMFVYKMLFAALGRGFLQPH